MSSFDRRKELLNKPVFKLSKCIPNLKKTNSSLSEKASTSLSTTQIPTLDLSVTKTEEAVSLLPPQPPTTTPAPSPTPPTIQQTSFLVPLTQHQETTMREMEELLTSCIANHSNNNSPLIILLHGDTQCGKTFLVERFLLKHATKIDKRHLDIESVPLSFDHLNYSHFNKWMQNIALLLQERPMFANWNSTRIPFVVLDNYDSLFRSFNTSDEVDENTISFKLIKSVQSLLQIFQRSKTEFFVAILISTIKPDFISESFRKYFQSISSYQKNFVPLVKDGDFSVFLQKSFCDYKFSDDDYMNLLEFETQRNELVDIALFDNHLVDSKDLVSFYNLQSDFTVAPFELVTRLMIFLKDPQHNQSLKQHFAKLFGSWSSKEKQYGKSLSLMFRLYRENLWPNIATRKREWKLRQIENFNRETINNLQFYQMGLDDYNPLHPDYQSSTINFQDNSPCSSNIPLFDQWGFNG